MRIVILSGGIPVGLVGEVCVGGIPVIGRVPVGLVEVKVGVALAPRTSAVGAADTARKSSKTLLEANMARW